MCNLNYYAIVPFLETVMKLTFPTWGLSQNTREVVAKSMAVALTILNSMCVFLAWIDFGAQLSFLNAVFQNGRFRRAVLILERRLFVLFCCWRILLCVSDCTWQVEFKLWLTMNKGNWKTQAWGDRCSMQTPNSELRKPKLPSKRFGFLCYVAARLLVLLRNRIFFNLNVIQRAFIDQHAVTTQGKNFSRKFVAVGQSYYGSNERNLHEKWVLKFETPRTERPRSDWSSMQNPLQQPLQLVNAAAKWPLKCAGRLHCRAEHTETLLACGTSANTYVYLGFHSPVHEHHLILTIQWPHLLLDATKTNPGDVLRWTEFTWSRNINVV